MSYSSIVLKDNPLGYWPLDEATGTAAYDASGCGNDGTYSWSTHKNTFPLVSGGQSGTVIDYAKYITLPIEQDYTGSLGLGAMANKYSSDNDFSLEVWVYLKPGSNTEIPILYAGGNTWPKISYQDGAIWFYINDSTFITHALESINESIHIVATYSKNIIILYVNGKLVNFAALNNFQFDNTDLPYFQIGPTNLSTDSFVVDAPAIYRYALSSEDIQRHFNSSQPIRPIQIVQPDGGVLFSGTDAECLKAYEFSYPGFKKWSNILVNGLAYDKNENYITLDDTTSSVEIYDNFTIPSKINFISSKIEWDSDNGISVYASEDGESWTGCDNGYPLPQYVLGDNTMSSANVVYLKIVISSVDPVIIKPKLKNLKISFFTQKIFYADNSGEYISLEQPVQGNIDSSVWDMVAPSENYPVLKRKDIAGFKPCLEAGFVINTDRDIMAIEMITRTPDQISQGCLFSSGSAYFSWDSALSISKSGISSIYINGQNATSATDLSQYLNGDEIYHIVINLSSAITNKIYINSKVISDTWSNSGVGYSYSNIAIYPSVLSGSVVTEHYNLYTENAHSYSDPVSIVMTETEVKAYNNDWEVIKSV